jgi:DNA-binding CsgD family transcriptional regulator/PAS domain-containing protein
LQIITAIYDAAVTSELWPGALESCREFTGGTSAAIFAKDVTGNRRQLFHIDGRLDLEQTRVYFSRLAPIDPSNTVQVYAELEEGVITSQKLNPEDFAQSRFAVEWAAPQGIVDVGFATLERRGDWAALFGVFRTERDGLGDEVMRQRLSLLAPHVRRAVNIAGIIGQANRTADTFRGMIDGLATAVLLIDAEGRLVHANHAGEALLGQRGASTSSLHGKLRLDRGAMRQLLQHAPLSQGSTFLETTSGERLVVHILPLTGGARTFAGLGGDPVAAVFVQPAQFDPPSIPESLARAFDLTPAELRVALSTLRHDKVADVADNLGVSEATVKTHLSHIFSKTDTKRQADIVKLVAAFKSPLAGS